MELRSGKILPSFPGDSNCDSDIDSNRDSETKTRFTTNMANNVTVVNTRSAITPFQGRIDGVVNQSVESWIQSVEAHLVSNNIQDDALMIQAAKSFMDLARGDLQYFVRSKYFESCTTWESVKSFLREIYGGDRFNTANMLLRSLILMSDRRGSSFIQNSAQIYDRTKEVIQRLSHTEWATTPTDAGKATSGYFISSANLQSLLLLAVQLASLPDALVNTFDVELGPDSSEKDILRQIVKHKGKIENLDPTIMKQAPRNTNSKYIAATNQRLQRTTEQNPYIKCTNCQRMGHLKRDCTTQYCAYHNTTNHKWNQCRAQGFTPKKNFNQQNTNRGYQQQRSQYKQTYTTPMYNQQQQQQQYQQHYNQQQQHQQQNKQYQKPQPMSYANVVMQSTPEQQSQVTNPNTGAISKNQNFQTNQGPSQHT